jgi:hypothetical protein
VIVCPDLKTDDAIDRLALTGQDGDSDVRMFPKIAGERQIVFPRQHSIHRLCLEDTAHNLAAFGGADAVTLLAEIGLDKRSLIAGSSSMARI